MSVDLSDVFDEQGLFEDDAELSPQSMALVRSVVARQIGFEDTTPTAAEATLFVKDMLKLCAEMNDLLEFEATQAMAAAGLSLIEADASGDDDLMCLEVPLHLVNAEAARGMEDFDEAMASSLSAVRLLQNEGFPMDEKRRKLSQAGAYLDIAQTALAQEDGGKSKQAAEAALAIYQGLDEKLYMGKAHEQIAEAHGLNGDRADAVASINAAIELFADVEAMAALSSGFARLADLQMNDRNWEAGEQAVLAAVTAAPKDGASMEFDGAMLALVRLVKAKPQRREILVHRVAEVAEMDAGVVSQKLVEFEKLAEMGGVLIDA